MELSKTSDTRKPAVSEAKSATDDSLEDTLKQRLKTFTEGVADSQGLDAKNIISDDELNPSGAVDSGLEYHVESAGENQLRLESFLIQVLSGAGYSLYDQRITANDWEYIQTLPNRAPFTHRDNFWQSQDGTEIQSQVAYASPSSILNSNPHIEPAEAPNPQVFFPELEPKEWKRAPEESNEELKSKDDLTTKRPESLNTIDAMLDYTNEKYRIPKLSTLQKLRLRKELADEAEKFYEFGTEEQKAKERLDRAFAKLEAMRILFKDIYTKENVESLFNAEMPPGYGVEVNGLGPWGIESKPAAIDISMKIFRWKRLNEEKEIVSTAEQLEIPYGEENSEESKEFFQSTPTFRDQVSANLQTARRRLKEVYTGHGVEKEFIGSCSRTVTFNKRGEIKLHNSLLTIQEDYQSLGIANAIYIAGEKFARDNEWAEVDVLANISVGKYAWAKQGFDFAEQQTLETMKTGLRNMIMSMRMEPEKRDDALERIEKLAHSWEVASFNVEDIKLTVNATGKDYKCGLGKAVMLAYSGAWEGVKRMDESSESYQVGYAYQKVKELTAKKK